MKQAILHGPCDLRIEDLDLDTDNLSPGQIWVQTEVTALSTGTDRGNYEGSEQVPGAPTYPRWIGYSNVGRVRAVGSAVERFQVGDRVFATKPHMSDYITSEMDTVVKVPDQISAEAAVFAKLYHLGFHSLMQGQFEWGKNIAVIGLGVIGLGTVELACSLGSRVIAIGNDDFRLAKAREAGAYGVFNSNDPEVADKVRALTKGADIELVVLAANPWSAYAMGMEILSKNGTMAILSLPGRGEPQVEFNPLALKWIYAKSPTIIAAHQNYPEAAHLHSALDYILFLMEEKKIYPERLITHRLPYDRMVEAYEMAVERNKSMIGAVFTWAVDH